MRVIKRNESEQDFCIDKIEKAIMKANSTVGDEDKMNDDAIQKVLLTVQKKLTGFNSVKVEDIQDFVEQALVRHNKYAVAKSYILYRDNKKRSKKYTEAEEKILSLIDGTSSLRGDNANKHIDDNASIRDYIAGIMCKSLANKTLPKEIIKAHNEGIIHWHDADYSPTQPLMNCDLYNLEDMFKNGFVMGDTKIEPNDETPFRTMVNLAAQIALLISGRQYGGQTMSWIHLVPYVDQTRKIIRKKILQDFNDIGVQLSEDKLNSLTEKKVRDEIAEGVKIYQYQILCHSSANGQTPFVSNNLCLREARTKQELDDFALIIEEILKRRIKGVKDPSGNYISPLFPKLLYWTCDGLNVKKGDPYYYLTELAAKCISKRMQPDIVSESQTRKYKQGQIIPCMGCVDKDDVVTYKYKDSIYTESIKRMWDRLSSEFEVKLQEAIDCYYIDLVGVCIYDSNSNGFVDCLRINKNADQGDWKLVKLSNGRSLTCTSDHPLAVIGKGRTEVKDLCIDDEIEATNFAYSAETENIDPEYAWMLATIMCDGCYERQLSSTFAMNGEDDIIERYSKDVEKYLGLGTFVKECHRGVKGDYKEVRATNGKCTIKETQAKLYEIFGGMRKKDRSIPSFIIHSNREARIAFMAGIIDADGYIHKSDKHFNNIEVGSTNKELAIQTMYLANTLGYDAKMLLNHYTSSDSSKIRYRIYFNTNDEIVNAITCQKKKDNYETLNRINPRDKHYIVTDIIDLGYRDEYSYDVTTGSDRFDVSGIQSHNCRSLLGPIWEERTYPVDTKFFWTEGGTYPYEKFLDERTFESLPNGEYNTGYDEGQYCINFRGNTGWLIKKTDTEVTIKEPMVYGRWNNGVITINLPYVALESRENGIDFYENLDKWLELCRKAMQERVKSCRKIKAKNSPILWMYGALARMEPEQTVGDLMDQHPTRPTVSLGYVGLYETVQALIGESNTTENGRKLCKEIMQHLNDKLQQWKKEDNIMYAIYGTPAELLTYKFALALRKNFGFIPNITDKDYVVNSYHVDPREEIDAFKKLEIEGEYLALSSGGAVSYVETADLNNNPEAIIKIIQWMHDHIIYAEVNRKIGICKKCGYEGDIDLVKTENGNFKFICPKCGNDDDEMLDVTARICGYLGKVNAGNTNKGRLDDIYNRVIHTDIDENKDAQE